jgi:hypothetical protein
MMFEERTEVSGGFLMAGEHLKGACFVLRGPWLSEYADVVRDHGVVSIRLSSSAGWKEDSIEFLPTLDGLGIRGVEVYSLRVKDLSPINEMTRLEFLGIETSAGAHPELGKLSSLKALCLDRWYGNSASLNECRQLEYVNLAEVPHCDLQWLRPCKVLRSIVLHRCRKLHNLTGIEVLPMIRQIELFRCPRLDDITALGSAQSLEEVEFDSCSLIRDIEPIGELHHLRRLLLNNCGGIKSLLPLRTCKKLERVLFIESTNIEDGNLAPLLDLPLLRDVSCANRRHYSPSRLQLQEMVTQRQSGR